MEQKTLIFVIVLLLFFIHTIFDHFFNWIFRKAVERADRHDELFPVIFTSCMQILEIFIIVKLLTKFLL